MTEFTVGSPLPARLRDSGSLQTCHCWHCGAKIGLLGYYTPTGPGYRAPDGYELVAGPGGLPLFQPTKTAQELRRMLRKAASDPVKPRRYSARAWLENRRGPLTGEEWPRWWLKLVNPPALARCERCGTLNRIEVDGEA